MNRVQASIKIRIAISNPISHILFVCLGIIVLLGNHSKYAFSAENTENPRQHSNLNLFFDTKPD